MTDEQEEKQCKCEKPAGHFQVKKRNQNEGRWFWTCAERKCSFFEWDTPPLKAPEPAGDASDKDKGKGKKGKKQTRFPTASPTTIEATFTVHANGRIAAKFPIFHEKLPPLLRKIDGAEFDAEEKIWTFPPDEYKALKQTLEGLREEGILPRVNDIPTFVMDVLKAKAAGTGADDDEEILESMRERIPNDLLNKLMNFQKVGVKTAIKRRGKVLLGDEMGLGKTIQAIAICSYYRSEWPVLIICPSSLRLTWQAEIMKWLDVPENKIQVIFTSKDKVSRSAHFTITSYDLASRDAIEKQLEKKKYKIVVTDESHYLKSRDAKRTKSIIPLLKQADRALLLSGTPALSRPIELFTQLGALINPFATVIQFGTRFCDAKRGKYGWDFTGNSNIPELHWYLENTVLIRRLKKDVLHELPDKVRQCVYVEITSKAKNMFTKMMAENDKINDKLENAKVRKQMEQQQKARMEKRLHLIQMYKETGLTKLPAVKEYLQELYNNTTKKFIVFAHHFDVLNGLAEHFKELKAPYIRIDGSTPAQSRQDLCDDFQNNAETRVAVLGITAAGVGLTLHAADLVVFAELFWNPAQLLQGEDRAHRIGREGNVDIKYILANGTLDDIQWPLIRRKLEVVGQSIDGHSATMDTIEALDTREEKEKAKQPRIDTFFSTEENGEVLDELLGEDAAEAKDENEDTSVDMPTSPIAASSPIKEDDSLDKDTKEQSPSPVADEVPLDKSDVAQSRLKRKNDSSKAIETKSDEGNKEDVQVDSSPIVRRSKRQRVTRQPQVYDDTDSEGESSE